MAIGTSERKILCQSCLERGLEPNEAVYSWQGSPICDVCLGPILDNMNDVNLETPIGLDEDLPTRIQKALLILDELEKLSNAWPLTKEETLKCHEDFYNHRPPAIANLSLTEIESIFSRRKGILFAVRHKDERWANEIDSRKNEERERNFLKSKKEVTKKIVKNETQRKQNEKFAQALGLTLEAYEAVILKGKEQKFEEITGVKPTKEVVKRSDTGDVLKQLQEDIKAKRVSAKVKINPITGKPYE